MFPLQVAYVDLNISTPAIWYNNTRIANYTTVIAITGYDFSGDAASNSVALASSGKSRPTCDVLRCETCRRTPGTVAVTNIQQA